MGEKRRMTLAGVAITAAIGAVLPGSARADIDLFTRRIACQAEAKARIKPKRQSGREIYDVVVERRRAYVADCMVTGPQQPQSTASILPPPKPAPVRSSVAPGIPAKGKPNRG